MKSRSSNLWSHGVCTSCVFSNSCRCNTCPSSRAWPCLWPRCPLASPHPPCLPSPPTLACSPSPPSWPTTPTARPRQWRRTRPGRLQRGLPEERTGTSQTSADTTRRFGGGGVKCSGGKKKRKGKSVTVECNSGCPSAECWCRLQGWWQAERAELKLLDVQRMKLLNDWEWELMFLLFSGNSFNSGF